MRVRSHSYWRFTLSETNNNPGRGGGNRAWPLFVGLPIIVALAVAAVILIGGGAGQGQQGGDPAEQNPQQPTTEETEQAPPTEEPAADGEQASESGGEQASEAPAGDETLDSPAIGDEGAPVVMVEYSDYQ